MAEQDDLKRAAAGKALELVRDGMLLGLGSGTTARYFTEGVGKLVADGMKLRGVPTSRATAELAAANGIAVVEEIVGQIDLAIDGADEVDPQLDLIKGRGGALFREKLVAAAAKRFVVVVDESKMVQRLGVGVLPVEVLPFLWRTTAERLAELCSGLKVRGGEEQPYVTDNGNIILDLSFAEEIENASDLASKLKAVTGVVEHGLFIGIAGECIVGATSGTKVVSRPI
ncbi:MAG TPA: ribose-5-phosphate isomerase RpiA [Candidatus Dormibacteraeota bacterium]